MTGECCGVLAGSFIRKSQQPLVGIGAALCHSTKDALLFDDDGVKRVVAKPQGTRHTCGAAADHGYNRDRVEHCFYLGDYP